MKKTEEKVIRFISSASLIEKDDRILISLSGGPDSVFLLHFLNKFKQKYKIEIGAFHLNHSLRGKDADEDERFCKHLCRSLKIEYFSSKKDVLKFSKQKSISVEEAGRIIRYKLLNDISEQNNYSKIATAHIQDDNTETVLLNLIKGSGLTGMTGIPAKRGNIIRPVLCLSKDEILDYLHFYKLSYRIDESNLSEDFQRNFLRHQIIPFVKIKLNPSLDDVIFNSSLVFQSLKNFLETHINQFQKKVIKYDEVSITFNIKTLTEFNEAVISESLRKVVKDKWGISLNFNDTKRILGLIQQQTGTRIELSEKLFVNKDRESLILSKNTFNKDNISHKIKVGKQVETKFGTVSIRSADKEKSRFNNDKNIEYISGDNISQNLTLRNWKSGDKFIPLGMKGVKKISDFLIDNKVSSSDKRNKLVLVDSNKIIWLLGERIDNRFKIKPETKKVLELCWKPKEK